MGKKKKIKANKKKIQSTKLFKSLRKKIKIKDCQKIQK